MTDPAPARKRRRSGSETRKLDAVLPPVRCSAADHAAVRRAADRAGLSVGPYMLATVLKAPARRSLRRPPSVDQKALAQILAQAGRLVGNVNQIAHRVNLGGFPEGEEFREAAKEIIALRDQIRSALHGSRRDH